MSAAHLAPIDRLADLFRGALADLEAGRAPDLDAFTRHLDTCFRRLEALGPIDPSDPIAERCRVRLTELDALRTRLAAVLGEVRGETGERLGRIATGRRSIGAYRASFDSGRKGHTRGQG